MIHHTCVIGDPPEDRRYLADPSLPKHFPQIHPSVEIAAFCTVDCGSYDGPPTRIGEGTYILSHSHVAHNVQIGKNVELATGTVLGGYVEVGDNSKLGLGVVVLPYRRIGKGCVIGAGAVVTSDVPDGAIYAGNPARAVTNRDPRPFTERRSDDVHNEVFKLKTGHAA